MQINITDLTDETIMRRACDMTRKPGLKPSTISREKLLQCEHSPVHLINFWIELLGIPTFVSTHLVRHKIGVSHFVESNRDDTVKRPEGSCTTLLGLTAKGLHSIFTYKNGALYWKIKPSRSPKEIGDPAGTITSDGRYEINYCAHRALRYRIIFLMHHGWCPPLVDHINGDPSDDRIENLRPATKQQNAANMKPKNGSFKGVILHHTGKYQASIMLDGARITLGSYTSEIDAAVAYDKAALEYFGEYARLNFPDADRQITRNDLVQHGMHINAQALINMSRKRLCYNSHPKTVAVWMKLKKALRKVCPATSNAMVPECVYRGKCPELRECKPGVEKVMKAYQRGH